MTVQEKAKVLVKRQVRCDLKWCGGSANCMGGGGGKVGGGG